MLATTGHVVNWIAAGIIFPLMLLPLAGLISSARSSALVWLILNAILVGAGILFAWLTPVLSVTPAPMTVLTFSIMAVVLTGVVFAMGGVSVAISAITPTIDKTVTGAGRVVMWLLLLMALVQFAVVILRYVFGINYIFMQESIIYMHGAVFMIAAGYALLTNDHVRVDIFYREASEKRKALVDFIGTYLLLFPVCILLLWVASPYVGNSWAVFEGSPEASGIQGVYILKSFIPAFAILLAMAGFNIAAKAGATLRGRR